MIDRKISVVGLGYVGLPLAVSFAKKMSVVGYDINAARVAQLKGLIDTTKEVTAQQLKQASLSLTTEVSDLKQANFHIIAVPTPIDSSKQPDLTILKSATQAIATILKQGDIVVYESTVFPGATEEVCIPLLESISGLKAGSEFHVGYSPERINPGDKAHTFEKIMKVVSAQDNLTLDIIDRVYSSVVLAGTFRAKSIRVAEAAKVIENTQRDVNIAFINELYLIFDRLGLNIHDVLEAANTKWNFLNFKPGLVGGHCIGVDPYYLAYKAQQVGYYPDVILSGRRVNDGMGKYVAEKTIKKMISNNIAVHQAIVGILGFSFKKNCPDIRNTRVIDIVKELRSYSVNVSVHDPCVDQAEVLERHSLRLVSLTELKNLDALIIAVDHDLFIDIPINTLLNREGVVVDLQNLMAHAELPCNV